MDDGIPFDALPITHIVVDCLARWLERDAFTFDENPGYKGPICKLVMAVRMDAQNIYAMAALAVYNNPSARASRATQRQSQASRQAPGRAPGQTSDLSAFLLALYTNSEHTGKGYGSEALHIATSYLSHHQMPARLPLQRCINSLLAKPWYAAMLKNHGWDVNLALEPIMVAFPSTEHQSKALHSLVSTSGLPKDPSFDLVPLNKQLHCNALLQLYAALPCLVAGICITEHGRYRADGRWVTSNVGNAFALALVRLVQPGCTFVDLALMGARQGGSRDSQLRAMRAPPILQLDLKQSASYEIQRASEYLLRQTKTRHTDTCFDLLTSITYPPWQIGVQHVADNWAAGKLHTLIPNFFSIDPEHLDYPGKREKRAKRGD